VFTGDTAVVSGATKAIPSIPITVMSEALAALTVTSGALDPPPQQVLSRDVRERWNDYGIGLLLQGDLKAAEVAFRKVIAIDPAYADGPVNVARVQVQEGNMLAAIPMLERALAIEPRLARAHFFMAMAIKPLGRYDEALDHLNRAAASYPRDRVVLDQIGRIYFLQRRYRDAIGAFNRALLVDPEDLQAHYNLMLCYQGLGDDVHAARERALYERFKADEAAQSITGAFRLKSPEDNNERQSIHEHRGAGLR
jgi:tetratricopeptide (TPR) repeat protein